MYTTTERERYSALLRESGLTDEAQISSVLDFVYRLAVIAADEYQENTINQNGKKKEKRNCQA